MQKHENRLELPRKQISKILNWEFWPFSVFYVPVYFYWFFLTLRTGSPFFFSAANPKMKLGGFFRYSKYKVLSELAPAYRPKMALLLPGEFKNKAYTAKKIREAGIGFPLILKPDSGERGKQVSTVYGLEELNKKLQTENIRMIVQEFISEPLEFGVMYCRFPGEKTGFITSIVQKEFLSVVGDGRRSVRRLVGDHPRFRLYSEHLQNTYPEKMDVIPAKGEKLLLEPIGNHSRGTVFLDAKHLISQELTAVFDRIAATLTGFHFGRFDLKTSSPEALRQGKVRIMEVNGTNSEPAHIYQPGNSLLKAYRDLFSHWKTLYKISKAVHRTGAPYTPVSEGLRIMFSKKE